jgi:hypothetical protein
LPVPRQSPAIENLRYIDFQPHRGSPFDFPPKNDPQLILINSGSKEGREMGRKHYTPEQIIRKLRVTGIIREEILVFSPLG